MLLLSKYYVNQLLTIQSKVLHSQLVRATDLQLLGQVWSLSGFGSEMMVASDHDDGKLPVCQMSLKI